MDEEACCKSGCGNTSGVLVAFRAKSDEWDLLSAFLHMVFACNGNLTCLSGLFFLGADGCTVIENHHEPPQNESWFLVWILSKVPRYSILCYIMLYIMQYIYIYTHLWSSHKVPIFSKNFSARRTYGSAVEQASTKPGPKPERRYGVCCRHGRHGMIGGWWDGHRWTKQLYN